MEESEWFRTLGPPGLPCGLDDLRRVASDQCGLVTRQQCLAAGLSSKAIEVRLASGRWRRIQHGVYQTAPGREDWWSTAVAAHLACGPDAAWSHQTAAFVWGLLPAPPRTPELLVPRDFAARPPRGTIVIRSRHLDDRVDQLWWPWVTTVEDTILDIAEAATVDQLFALLGRAFQRQRTSETVVLARLAARARHPRRGLLMEVLGDVAGGAESAMELRYLRDVERAHGLPRGQWQHASAPGRPERHDVAYVEQRVLVELDGRLGHEGPAARLHDGRRDRRSARRGWLTMRAFWPDVAGTPCVLAEEVATVLQTRGWRDSERRCRRRACTVPVVSSARR